MAVLGGAFSQAKGAFSNWWSNLIVSPEPGLVKETEVEEIASEPEEHSISVCENARAANPSVPLPNNISKVGVSSNSSKLVDPHESPISSIKVESHIDVESRNSHHEPGQIHTV